MTRPPEPDPPDRTPALGRVVAGAVLALFLMVGLGLYWVWSRAQRERDWRSEAALESGMSAGPAGKAPATSPESGATGSPD